ncbi:MAG: hypothetical protein R2798_11560 [Chitinophagales bacterium]|nr:hypothetical protein [Bacteroidota bacterium]MCB9043155.1 hypothetical protein [Chitinophagales bacterium]
MEIKSNAAPNEISSPFYKANEAFCAEFEQYIIRKNGTVSGKYNAWSYLIYGKIDTPKNWDIMYKKATFTSTGNLFLSSEYQSMLVLAKWETERDETNNVAFKIKRKSMTDYIKLLLFENWKNLEIPNRYVIRIDDHLPPLVFTLTEILKSLFASGEIYEITLHNNKLKIELRSKKHHFDILDKLTKEV